jgi:uncharacterized protein (DUF342 family)
MLADIHATVNIHLSPFIQYRKNMSAATAHQGVDIGAKLIGEFINDAYTLRIEAHSNLLECRATIVVHATNNSISPAELISILRNHDITTTVDLEQVAIFCSEAALGEDPELFILAQGQPAVHGEDGWFELIVATGQENSDRVEDAAGRIDFKLVQTFSNVESGQHIGTIHPPTVGKPGHSITNESIPPKEGKPCQIRAGIGVEIDEETGRAIAQQAGRAIFDNSTLSVVDEFVVNGDVDLEVGHISFNGFVDIKGDILDDFNITATKGINVTGAIGACQISSEGPVTIGTMAGKGRGKITCSNTLSARYLNRVNVECHGDVIISHETRNSIIKSTGKIVVEKGLITGGDIVALEGIEVKTLGAQAGAKTEVTSGVFFPEADRLHYLRNQIKSLASQLKRIGTTLKSLNKNPLATQRRALREAIELRIGILTQRRANLDAEREELAEELLNFVAQDHPTANPKINVLGLLKEGVFINLGETREEITTEISGPVSVVENKQQNGLRYLMYSPLQINAEDLDAALELEES